MGQHPTGWRADGGYQYPPSSPPPVAMFYLPPPPPVWLMQGPVGLYGLSNNLPPPPPVFGFKAPELKEVKLPPPPPSEKKSEKKKKTPKKNPAAPPELNGGNYMFPRPGETTQVNIFGKASKIWEDKYKGKALSVKFFTVPTAKTVKSLIEFVRGGLKPDDKEIGEWCQGWAATQVYEGGNGTWYKGTTIEYGSDKATGTLASMGWTHKCGKELPPVHVTVHKV